MSLVTDLWAFQEPDYAVGPRSQNVSWFNIDRADTYRPEGNAYGPTDIAYTFNSDGFRCDDLAPCEADLRILFVGCSVAFGLGLPVEHGFAHRLVSALRGRGLAAPYWNVAFPGKSIEYCARAAYCLTPLLRPHVIIGLMPDLHRHELIAHHTQYREDGLEDYSSWSLDLDWPPEGFMRAAHTIFTDANDQHQAVRSMALIDMAAKAHGGRFLWSSWSQHTVETLGAIPAIRESLLPFTFETSGPERARDGIHFGAPAHQRFADDLLRFLEPTL